MNDIAQLDLPKRLSGLTRLVYNLWWTWNPDARALFRSLDLEAWRESDHNPIQMLASLGRKTLDAVVQDETYMNRYDAVIDRFDREVASNDGWFVAEYGRPKAPLAYMSAEYGLHASLPVYAGGLGMLAGDHLKECSDLAVPAVAVGLIYSQGYVWQHIGEDGWQDDVEETVDRGTEPILPVLDDQGNRVILQIPVFYPPVSACLWKVNVGRIPLYLLDTDLDQNQPWDRDMIRHLYASDLEQRLRQELLLGLGGMQALRSVGAWPAALHLNEGHPAFAVLERIRALVQDGATFQDALEAVRASTIFTTHTPVPAGTDVFPFQLMDKYLGSYYDELGTDRDTIMALGTNPNDPSAGFNMTVFALRVASHRNGVSKRHGEVARDMWHNLWPDESETPIGAITNGVHLPSWIEPLHMQPLLSRYLGPDWLANQDEPAQWELWDQVPDEELWRIHRELKIRLLSEIDARARKDWLERRAAPSSIVAAGAMLDPDVLTIGFARRFTSYKRPELVFHDLERLKRILNHPLRPVQIIFAGKAHPADLEGKRLIQTLFRHAQDPDFGGRIAFVENYDQELAEYLVHGVDVWLNNPLPPLEASGTSGMKAGANGILNLSVLDGWWIEGYNGDNGWAIGENAPDGDRNAVDAEQLYSLLETEIVPLYYERTDDDVPHDLLQRMKAATRSIAPRFSTRRMVKEYTERYYRHALGLA